MGCKTNFITRKILATKYVLPLNDTRFFIPNNKRNIFKARCHTFTVTFPIVLLAKRGPSRTTMSQLRQIGFNLFCQTSMSQLRQIGFNLSSPNTLGVSRAKSSRPSQSSQTFHHCHILSIWIVRKKNSNLPLFSPASPPLYSCIAVVRDRF